MIRTFNCGSSILLFTLLLVLVCFGCTEEVREIEVRSVADEEAEQVANRLFGEVSPTVADGLDIQLWAGEELLGDPVALHADHQGTVWVTVTERRRNAELDIRGHRDWMIEALTLESVEELRAFIHRELAPERSGENDWPADHNEDGLHDWRDLTVPKEAVFKLEDLTGNGTANRAEVFIRDFHEEITDVAGAILRYKDEIFVGVAPDLWRIRDTNGDGYGDTKESISYGYNTNIGFAGHGISGLVMGPDGRIYWSIGDRGMSVVDADGKKWHHPREGVIVRSDPDGSNFEVYATGFRNTHEFVFDKFGNLIAVDNDGDHAGEFERLIYVINGSDSGWRLNWQFGKYGDLKNNEYNVWMEEEYFRSRFENQSALHLPPVARYHNGPAGMAYNPGTALGAEWKDHFFVAEFVGTPTQSGINAFTLKESGASFELDEDKQVMQGILATGLDFGPDGALYVADWIEGWDVKQKGRIWKLDTVSGAEHPLLMETQNLLDEDFSDRPSNELQDLLNHEDMRVRQKAQFELVDRGDIESLLNAIADHNHGHQLSRIHGIWGLAQIGRRNPETAEPLIQYLDDPDPEIRAQAAKMLGDLCFSPAGEALIPLLKDENKRVQFFAVEALGRISHESAIEPILEMVRENNDEDATLRHGAGIALERIGNTEALGKLADHPSAAVRIVAVIALKRMESPAVARFLNDEDEFIVTNAARAINDDALIKEALPRLAAMLDQHRFVNEPLIRRAINASLYGGTQADATKLAEFALRAEVEENLRAEALRTLAVWGEPSVLDRVTGEPRGTVTNNREDAVRALGPVMAQILTAGSSVLKIAALEAVSILNIRDVIPQVRILIQEDPAPEVRIASLNALTKMETEVDEIVSFALNDPEASVRMNALNAISNSDLPPETVAVLLDTVLLNGTLAERQEAFRTLGAIEDASFFAVLERQMDLLLEGNLEEEVRLDLILAVESVLASSESLQKKLEEYQIQTQKPDDSLITGFTESLYGGNAEEGRRIFYRNEAAQCIRCHVVAGGGSEVGPDLTSVGARLSREQMLQALVDPDARIAPGYGVVTLTLKNGEVVRGVLDEETDAQITVTWQEQMRKIEKEDVAERVNTPSGMPAMGGRLTRHEIRDLIEYLTTLE